MLDYYRLSAMTALAAMFAFAAVSEASAAKKMSYEQAFAQCKTQVDSTVPRDQASARTSAGSACMQTLGFRLKKKSKL